MNRSMTFLMVACVLFLMAPASSRADTISPYVPLEFSYSGKVSAYALAMDQRYPSQYDLRERDTEPLSVSASAFCGEAWGKGHATVTNTTNRSIKSDVGGGGNVIWNDIDIIAQGRGSGTTDLIGEIFVPCSDEHPCGSELLAPISVTSDPSGLSMVTLAFKVWRDDPSAPLLFLNPGNLQGEMLVVAGESLHMSLYHLAGEGLGLTRNSVVEVWIPEPATVLPAGLLGLMALLRREHSTRP